VDAPTLETDRLILRAQVYDDWPRYRDFMFSKRSIGLGGPFKLAYAWGMFCHDLAQWSLFGHGALMLDDKKTGRCIGQVGINDGPLFKERELGWFVYEDAEGRGLAYEGASALRDWAFEVAGFDSLVSYVDPDNVKSRALAERLGARLDPAAPRNDPDDLVYRHQYPTA
jgi:RimJ/RimL family protein N-acetyltransferase